MNRKNKNSDIGKIFYYYLTLVVIIVLAGNAEGQQEVKAKRSKIRIKLEYFKKGDNTKQIKATASTRVKRKPFPVKMVTLNFYDETDSAKLIGTVETNEKGIATLTLPSDYSIGNGDNPSLLSVRFDGNESFKSASKEIRISDMEMNVTYKIIDSVYTVNIDAYEKTEGESSIPVSDVDVYVYVKRLFSLLKVGEGWLQDGSATVEIPNDLPGDKEGNLKFVVMIPDAEGYGTVESDEVVKWGKPLKVQNKYADENKRALWEPRAPLWMVITLSILLLGVFYHYFLIAFKLYKIKKIRKNDSV